jgi:uncharacterized protein YecE (DUF72 family)
MGAIKVGITSWADKSLMASGFYPRGAKSAEGRLKYYATQFPIVENDSAYYALPTTEQTEQWALRTPPGFTMNVKAFASLTEHYADPRRLPDDLRRALPEAVSGKARAYPKDLGPEILAEIAVRFREGIEPLRASGRLGVVLFQYPVWFTRTPNNVEQVAWAHELVPGCRVAVEFRNATWMSEHNRERTLSMLRDNGLALTCVDEPQGFASSVPPIAEATSDVAVVRFHGRSRAKWQKSARTASERFEYLYSVDELREWVPKISHLSHRTHEVHVLMNNCWQDYSVVNARQLTNLLESQRAAPSVETQVSSMTMR